MIKFLTGIFVVFLSAARAAGAPFAEINPLVANQNELKSDAVSLDVVAQPTTTIPDTLKSIVVKPKAGDYCVPSTDPTGKETAKWENKSGKLVCVITECVDGYKLDKDANKCEKTDKFDKINCVAPRYEWDTNKDKCIDKNDTACESGDANVKTAKYNWDAKTKKLNCVIKSCKSGYIIDNGKCIRSDGECSAEQLATLENATAGELKRGNCQPTTCADGYEISRDGKSCVAVVAKDDAQENNKSTANKLLGAAGIGSVGIGTQMAASALAEQNADDAAQRDMATYLATFKCDYGTGMNITGGQTDVELPGGNDLFTLVNEYKTLAADLKVRKESLGLAPGIESETIIDAAETGVYDNAETGKTGGAYASLARALSDETSDDAKQIAEQKSETAKKLKTGAITAGVGAVTTIAADLTINSKNKNKVDEIKNKYKNQSSDAADDADDGDDDDDTTPAPEIESDTARVGTDCKSDLKNTEHVKTAEWQKKKVGKKLACKITACDDGYDVNTTLNKCKAKKVKNNSSSKTVETGCAAGWAPQTRSRTCVELGKPCETDLYVQEGIATKSEWTKTKSGDAICKYLACADGYELKNDTCVSKGIADTGSTNQPEKTTTNEKQAGAPCTPDNPDNVDTAVWKQSGRRMTCTITKCSTGYKQNGNQCIVQCGQNESLVNGKCVAKTTLQTATNKTANSNTQQIDTYIAEATQSSREAEQDMRMASLWARQITDMALATKAKELLDDAKKSAVIAKNQVSFRPQDVAAAKRQAKTAKDAADNVKKNAEKIKEMMDSAK